MIGYAFFFVIFALLFEKFLFDRLSRYFFRWRPEVSSSEVVEEQFTPAVATAAVVSNANAAAMESLNQVTAGPRSERTDETRRQHDG